MSHFTFNENSDFPIALALRYFVGIDPFRISAFSDLLAANTETDISLIPGVTEIPLPNNAGQTIQVWSTDAGDTTQEIRVEGLGAGGVLIDSQTVTLNGTTPVDLPVQMSRINGALNISPTAVVGTVNIGVSPGTVFCNILPQFQKAKQALYTVPAGFTLVVPVLEAAFRKAAGTGDTGVLIFVKTKPLTHNYFYGDFQFAILRRGNSSATFGDEYPDGIPELTDIKISAESNDPNTEIMARINGALVQYL